MNPYAILGSGVGTEEAASLCARVTVWHDAMVAHERRLRMGRAGDVCDDECPHVEARTLWAEAVTTLGSRASELTFLRSRAVASGYDSEIAAPAESLSQAVDTDHGLEATHDHRRGYRIDHRSSDPSPTATVDL